MLQRKPDLREHMTQLQSGLGMPGGPENPLGARALYLWQGNKDTEIAPELTGHGLPLSKCEAYNRVYDQPYESN
jgi:hypothetical protein